MDDQLIRIYEPHIICSECGEFYATWKLFTTGKCYCDQCVENVTEDDIVDHLENY